MISSAPAARQRSVGPCEAFAATSPSRINARTSTTSGAACGPRVSFRALFRIEVSMLCSTRRCAARGRGTGAPWPRPLHAARSSSVAFVALNRDEILRHQTTLSVPGMRGKQPASSGRVTRGRRVTRTRRGSQRPSGDPAAMVLRMGTPTRCQGVAEMPRSIGSPCVGAAALVTGTSAGLRARQGARAEHSMLERKKPVGAARFELATP